MGESFEIFSRKTIQKTPRALEQSTALDFYRINKVPLSVAL